MMLHCTLAISEAPARALALGQVSVMRAMPQEEEAAVATTTMAGGKVAALLATAAALLLLLPLALPPLPPPPTQLLFVPVVLLLLVASLAFCPAATPSPSPMHAADHGSFGTTGSPHLC